MSIGAELVPADQRGDLALYALNGKTGRNFDWGWWIAGYKRAILNCRSQEDLITVKLMLATALANGLE